MTTPITQLASLDEERRDRLKRAVNLGSRSFVFPLFLIFWVADILYAPDQKWTFLLLRLIVVPALVIGNWFAKRAKTLLQAELACTGAVLTSSIPIFIMILILKDSASPYYAGLNLVGLGMGTLLPYRTRFFAFNAAAIYIPYFAFILFSIHSPNFRLAVVNLFFVSGTLLISSVVHYLSEQIYRKEHKARKDLDDEVTSRGKIIEQKTKEAVQLAQLTKQFSPQVLHAIQSGKIDIAIPIHEAQICAIFVDIVDSTERLNQLDRFSVNKVLNMYMADTMPILLKYDITIDKFLGDGVLGFSNDPIEHADYVDRVVNAALEIRGTIDAKQLAYRDLWKKEFSIKVGIAVGSANVGFYGHEHYTRSYTAIGTVINLASRLCGACSPNQILLSGNSIDILKQRSSPLMGKCEFTLLENTILKGFAKNDFSVYSIASDTSETDFESEVALCPNGHGVLFLDTDERGIFVFKCRTCGFGSEQKEEKLQRKAA